jgi:hypothetical protein
MQLLPLLQEETSDAREAFDLLSPYKCFRPSIVSHKLTNPITSILRSTDDLIDCLLSKSIYLYIHIYLWFMKES